MATRTARRSPPPSQAAPRPEATSPAGSAPGAESGEDVLDVMLAEFSGGDYQVKIERVAPKDAAGYLSTIDLTPQLLDDVKRLYGGGKYYGKVVRAGTHGYIRHITFQIAGAPRVEQQELATNDHVARLERSFADALAKLQPPQRDPMDVALKIVEAMRPMIQPPPAAQGNGIDMVQMLELLEAREAKGLELGRELAARSGDNDGLGGVLREMGPPLLHILGKDIELRRHQATRQNPPATLPTTTTPAPVSNEVAVTFPAGYEWLAELRHFLPMLSRLAKGNKDAALYADVILDQAPAELLDQVKRLAQDPAFVDTVVQLTPEMAPWEGWFRELVGHLRDGVVAEEEDGADAEG